MTPRSLGRPCENEAASETLEQLDELLVTLGASVAPS